MLSQSPSSSTASALKPRRVQLLNPIVAERIAAGEVIERPSSVVKELVENSLDAGATEIVVALEDGGKLLIEVTDNGSGMEKEDLAVCVQRHATSKLSSLEDLEKISTLGFRGEALPSIAAVSELSILSRTLGSTTAYEWKGLGTTEGELNAVTFGHFINSYHGTRIQARGLFSQIPARLKFLKSQNAEVTQVREWIERLALTRPDVGFKLISNDRTLVNLRPQTETARIKAILSEDEDYPIATSNHEPESDFRVRAHWIQGLSSPQTKRLVQVVNGRVVRDRMLQQAILAPFKQSLLPGQFPAIALYIEVDPATLDVNVHPTKTEIRFLETRKVFQAVESLIASMVLKHGAAAFVPTQTSSDPAQDPGLTSRPHWTQGFSQSNSQPQPQSTWRASEPLQSTWSFQSPPTVSASEPTHAQEQPAPRTVDHPLIAGRLVGILFNTYFLYDLGNELALVDQHAADERVRYERLKKRVLNPVEGATHVPQALLLPEAVKFDSESRTLLEERLPWLEKFGFEVELFGEDTLLFRAIPGEWGKDTLRTRLKNLVDRLLALESPSNSSVILDETLFETLASEACHSSVRAGDRLENMEASALVEKLFQCEHPWNCPHGRPTLVRVPRGKLEEWFQRRV